MRPLTNWIPRPWAFIICYIFGFLACLVSQLIVSHESGPVAYANFLSAIAFVFTEWWGAALSTFGQVDRPSVELADVYDSGTDDSVVGTPAQHLTAGGQ